MYLGRLYLRGFIFGTGRVLVNVIMTGFYSEGIFGEGVLHGGLRYIIYIPSARVIRGNISVSDDIFPQAFFG